MYHPYPFLKIHLSTKKNKHPPIRFAMIVADSLSLTGNRLKQEYKIGVDSCQRNRYKINLISHSTFQDNQ